MNYSNLVIGRYYADKDLGTVSYEGRWKMDLFVEGETGVKGARIFKIFSFGKQRLVTLTKKQIETDLREI